MNEKLLVEEFDRNLVYIKKIPADGVSWAASQVGDEAEAMYAVHDAEGVRLAVVANRRLAFHLAHENELVPVTVH